MTEKLSSVKVSVITPSNITITPSEKELSFRYAAGDKKIYYTISEDSKPINFSFESSSSNFKAVKKDDKTIELMIVENKLFTAVTGILTIKNDSGVLLKEYILVQ